MSHLIGAIVLFVVLVVGMYFGRSVTYETQWPLYEALRTTASIVFGVMGAWIALIYPDALSKILDKNYENKKQEIHKIKRVLRPLIFSSFCVIIVLLIGILAPVLKQIPHLMQNVELVRGISYALLGCLTLYMGWVLLMVLVPGQEVKQELEQLQKKQDLIKTMQSRVRKSKPNKGVESETSD
ncbi:MAG: hypothetical protein KZQ94_07370 [Candidatus Thiodiazotropha sp. (ex Troendleina suluensis)]|nr:hypothetical protein [Candidatus Thiodiazotropha sp. (ex Troendleina suluensis)]